MIKFTALYICFTFLLCFFTLSKRSIEDRHVLFILLFSTLSELVSFLLHKYFSIPLSYTYNLYTLLVFSTWILFIGRFTSNLLARFSLMLFWVCYCTNVIFLQHIQTFGSNAFIAGALIYCFLFLQESYRRLYRDDTSFFASDFFIALFAPVLFFSGFSFLFAFAALKVSKVNLLQHFTLYDFINYFTNTVYYSCLNFYAIRTFIKSKNG